MKMKRQVVYFDNIEEKNALLNYFETNGYRWMNGEKPLQFDMGPLNRGFIAIDDCTLTYSSCVSYDNFLDKIEKTLLSAYEIINTHSLIGDFKLPKEADLMAFLEV